MATIAVSRINHESSLLEEVIDNLSEEDKQECLAWGWSDPRDGIADAVQASNSFVVLVDGSPSAVFGVCPESHRVWMMSTPVLKKHFVSVAREARFWLRATVKEAGLSRVCNLVWTKNRSHVRFLQFLGAKFGNSIGDFQEFTLCV